MTARREHPNGLTESDAPSPRRRPPGPGRPRRWRVIGVAVVALASLGAVARGVSWVLLEHPHFFLSSVELRGGKFAAISQVEDQFISDRGRSLLRAPLEERRRAIERIPWVRSASVTRVFPDRIAVTIEERVPVAFVWAEDGIALLDEDGVLLDMPPNASFAFPVVRGVSEDQSPAERHARMQLFMDLLNDLDRGEGNLRAGISEVDLSDPRDARVVVGDPSGAVLLHLGHEGFLSRYLLYASQISQWQQKFANVRSVDLRFDGQVVINADPLTAPPPAMAPGARASSPNTSR